MLLGIWNKSSTPLSHFSLGKGRGGGCDGMEIQLANKLWNAVGAKQSWSSKCDFLQNIWRKMKLWWGQGHSAVQSLDKNTILGLNTKFSFMNYKITVSGSKGFYFFFLCSELLTHLLVIDFSIVCGNKMDGYFPKALLSAISVLFCIFKEGIVSRFSWWKLV